MHSSHRRHSASPTWDTITGSGQEVLQCPKMVQVHRVGRGRRLRGLGDTTAKAPHPGSRSSWRAGSDLRPDARLGLGRQLTLHQAQPALPQVTVGYLVLVQQLSH